MFWPALVILVTAPLVAHGVGWAIARLLHVPPGRAAQRMPRIPEHRVSCGRAAGRFERRRRRAEHRFLRRYYRQGIAGMDESHVAAALGVRRDVRRATAAAIARALDVAQPNMDLHTLSETLSETFRPAWRRLDPALVLAEAEAVAQDLQLELDMDSGGRAIYRLDDLRERWHRLHDFQRQHSAAAVAQTAQAADEQGEIVFDTAQSLESTEARAQRSDVLVHDP